MVFRGKRLLIRDWEEEERLIGGGGGSELETGRKWKGFYGARLLK
jgi:hypothetical protein